MQKGVYLNGGGIDVKFLEDSEGLLVEFVVDSNVGYIRRVVVVQPVDVLHNTRAVRLNGCKNTGQF